MCKCIIFDTRWADLSLGVSSSNVPSLVPLMIFLLEPLRLFFLPESTSSAICDSTSASSAASVSCLISGAKSPPLPVSFLPLLNSSSISSKSNSYSYFIVSP